MNPGEMLSEITAYFVQGKYPDAVMNRMRSLIESIDEEERRPVLDHLIENQKATFKVGVSDIVESCKALGVGYRAARYTPAEDWTCDACGHQFKYTPSPTDDDKIDKYMTDFCPECGLQPYYTTLAQRYNELGISTAWYTKLVDSAHRWGHTTTSTVSKTRMGGQWSVGGIFWHRSAAEAERREQKQIAIAAKMAELDRAKRWDLKEGA